MARPAFDIFFFESVGSSPSSAVSVSSEVFPDFVSFFCFVVELIFVVVVVVLDAVVFFNVTTTTGSVVVSAAVVSSSNRVKYENLEFMP